MTERQTEGEKGDEKHEESVEWEQMRGKEWKEESGSDRSGRVIGKQWSKSK